MPGRVAGQRALVTGASRSIGAGIAEAELRALFERVQRDRFEDLQSSLK